MALDTRSRIVDLLDGGVFVLSALEAAHRAGCSVQYVYYVAARDGLPLSDNDAPSYGMYKHWEDANAGEELSEEAVKEITFDH